MRRIVGAILLLLSLAACDGFGSPTVPSDGSGATNEPRATAPVPAPPQSTVSESLRAADAQNRSAQNYRIEFSFVTTVTNGTASKTDPFLLYNGSVQGANSHVFYNGGAFNEILGGGVRIEVVNAERKTYIKGSTMFGSSDPTKWYVFPDSRMSSLPLDPQDIMQLIAEDYSGARQDGTPSLNGQACALWKSDFRHNAGNLLEWMIGPGTSADAYPIDSAEARYTVCRDGYIHVMEWDVAAHNINTPAERSLLAVRARLSDFNAGGIAISAPSGAIEIK